MRQLLGIHYAFREHRCVARAAADIQEVEKVHKRAVRAVKWLRDDVAAAALALTQRLPRPPPPKSAQISAPGRN